jgi:hypothetical protein
MAQAVIRLGLHTFPVIVESVVDKAHWDSLFFELYGFYLSVPFHSSDTM